MPNKYKERNQVTVKDATNYLICTHAFGKNRKNYLMLCKFLKDMPDGRKKVLVIGDRYWNTDEALANGATVSGSVRYVKSERVIEMTECNIEPFGLF